MDSSSGMFKIEKLSDSNFHVWKQKVQLILSFRELDDHIADEPAPPPPDDSEKWSKDDAKAKAIIGLSISDDHLQLTGDCESALELWKSIIDLYQRKTLLNKVLIRRKFYSVKMTDNEKVMPFISRVRQLAADCKAMDVPIDDTEMAMTMLCGLPSKYDNLIVAIDAATADTSLSMDFVKSRLLQEEQRMMDREKVQPLRDAALVSHPKGNAREPCDHCGKTGHPPSRCWQKFPHLRPNRNGNSGKQTGLAAKTTPAAASEPESSDNEICLVSSSKNDNRDDRPDWIIDSGCTSHICNDRRMFSDMDKCEPFPIVIGDSSGVEAAGRGSIALVASVNGKPRSAKIENVAFAPDMAFNMLSVSSICRDGKRCVFEKNSCTIEKDGKIVAEGEVRDGLYCLKTITETACAHKETAFVADMNLWHERLAHVHVEGIRNMVRSGVVEGVKIKPTNHLKKCKGCVYGKASRAPIPKSSGVRSKSILDLVHTDVCGPFPEESLGGSLYFVTFIDDCSRYAWVYSIASKSDVFATFKKWLATAENMHRRKLRVLTPGKQLRKWMNKESTDATLKVLQSDNGGEYLSNQMKEFLEKRGITHRLTAPGNPYQNGVAERLNRTLVESVRSMLHHKDLPKHFWAEALSVAVHVRNRVTTRGVSSQTTPYEIMFGRKPNLAHVRVFGSRCWYYLGMQKVDKLDKRAREAIMVGYARGPRGYKLWDLADGKVVVSRDVRFDEDGKPDNPDVSEVHLETGAPGTLRHESDSSNDDDHDDHDEKAIQSDSQESQSDSESDDDQPPPSDNTDDDSSEVQSEAGDQMEVETEPLHHESVRYPKRNRKKPGAWWESTNTALVSKALCQDPKTFTEAVARSNGKSWKDSMELELASLKENDCWNLVPRPKYRKVIRSKWVFKTKEEQTVRGHLGVRLKSRVVACGYGQVEGVDYTETYAPVVKMTSIRVIVSITATLDLHLHQMDVVTAFLNGDLVELIFMEQPPGFEQGSPGSLVCRLKKAIYGLKQAPRQWYAKIDDFFVRTLGMERNPADDCVYVRRQGGHILIIALYVDDLLIACSDMSVLQDTKRDLSSRFKMKDLGESRVILGLDISRDRVKRTLSLNQTRYAEKVIDRFGMGSARGQPTPMDTTLDLTQPSPPTSEPYREAIGSLMYLMVGTRPDLAYCVGVLSKHVQNPTQLHWDAVKRVLRYVIHTKNLGLVYDGAASTEGTTVYVDADWAGDIETRRSMSGYAALMSGSLVAWGARQQEVVALSSAESEYISLCAGTKETIWLRSLIGGLGVVPNMDTPTTIMVDNQAAIALAHNAAVNRRNKHIHVRFHFTRDAIHDGQVRLKYCPTDEMIADMFTKPLGRVKLQTFVAASGMGETASAETQ